MNDDANELIRAAFERAATADPQTDGGGVTDAVRSAASKADKKERVEAKAKDREPKEPRDRGRLVMALGGVGLALALVGGVLAVAIGGSSGAESVTTANQTVHMYRCPGAEPVGTLRRGEEVRSVARSHDAKWLAVKFPTDIAEQVWVPASEVSSDVPVSDLPVARCSSKSSVEIAVEEDDDHGGHVQHGIGERPIERRCDHHDDSRFDDDHDGEGDHHHRAAEGPIDPAGPSSPAAPPPARPRRRPRAGPDCAAPTAPPPPPPPTVPPDIDATRDLGLAATPTPDLRERRHLLGVDPEEHGDHRHRHRCRRRRVGVDGMEGGRRAAGRSVQRHFEGDGAELRATPRATLGSFGDVKVSRHHARGDGHGHRQGGQQATAAST